MRIVTLVDNYCEQAGLVGEHGLAIYVETAEKKILFDTGAGQALLPNAQRLGIDLALVDELVLSHGHHDHTGGLAAFVRINRRARIRMSPAAFVPKFKGREDYIGIPVARELFADRVAPVTQPVWIAGSVRVMPAAPLVNRDDTHFEGMYVCENGECRKDEFEDELSLLVENGERCGVISACGHRGITNIVAEATKLSGEAPAFVLGGMHLKGSSPEQIDPIVETLAAIPDLFVAVAHCSGMPVFGMLRERMPGRVAWAGCGHVLEF